MTTGPIENRPRLRAHPRAGLGYRTGNPRSRRFRLVHRREWRGEHSVVYGDDPRPTSCRARARVYGGACPNPDPDTAAVGYPCADIVVVASADQAVSSATGNGWDRGRTPSVRESVVTGYRRSR